MFIEENKEELKKDLIFLGMLLLFIFPILGKNLGILVILIFIVIKSKKYLKKLKYKSMNSTIDVGKMQSTQQVKKTVISVVIGIFVLWLFFSSIIIVEAGTVGVYSLFGKVRDKELNPGFHLIIPLAKVTEMSIRTEEYTMSITEGEGRIKGADAITSLTKEGLSIDLDITVLYSLEGEKASDIYSNIGLRYEEKIIRPSIRTAIRDIIAQYEAKDIYSQKRQEASKKILESLQSTLSERGINMEEVLLRNVVLPDSLANAIQDKLEAEQEAEKYDFILVKEKKEKERKVIEAEGQRDAQSIINQSLTQNYLYYLYISELKDREGTIYVPIGSGTGMPLFNNVGR